MTQRICIIRHRDYELQIRREAEALRDAGYAVDVICLREPGHGFAEDDAGVRLYRIPLSRERAGVVRYLFDYVSFLVLAACLVTVLHVRSRYAAIQANTMPDALGFASVVPRLLGAKAVTFMHEPSPELADMQFGSQRVTSLFGWIEQAVLRYSDHAFAVTEDLKQLFVARGADPSKIDVILNGPDPAQFATSEPQKPDAPDAPFTLLCHGTIEERYGHLTLLDAVAIARTQVPGLQLVITGSGSGVDAVVRRIEELDLSENVRYLGHVPLDELMALLRSADAGVVPMRSNAYSNVVHTNKMYEYILLKKPVIATRLSSVRAYFGEDAIAFATPDDAGSMADVIIDLAHHPEKREALAARASELYREYGWDRQRELYVDAYDRLLGRARSVESPTTKRRQSGLYLSTKRVIDVAGAVAATAVLSPLLALIAIAVKLDSPGPVLYRARRLGRDRDEITVYKFRTMHHGVDDGPHRDYVQRMLRDETGGDADGMFKLTDDARVTRCGSILRKWSLDELPQLLNVIKGDMSLVGPRPEVAYALEGYLPDDHRRFEVLPGMTGLWQVEGRANLSPRDMLALDSRYAQTCSLWMDVRLLVRTVPAVLARVGSA